MSEHLVPLYTYTLPYHVGFAHAMLGCAVLYLVITQLAYRARNYSLYVRYYLPLYHTIIACSIFTGIIMLAAFEFRLSHKSAVMVLVAVLLIGSSAAGYARLKRYLRLGERDKFRKFALIKGILDIALILIASKA
ncbi:hypothetical protein [Campylobacter sp. 19-13652]|uniref:hypothetical protein n=1 Tax=Campylobacter sp. 19-13652 TaxID=2840180 RepID=UPI001C774914|nr:hypothetical protein [Campylobacter sp. 19-13652]BCX80119.1 hypothetical protein LBC_15810 [Campylobacter sp. 19-13652]